MLMLVAKGIRGCLRYERVIWMQRRELMNPCATACGIVGLVDRLSPLLIVRLMLLLLLVVRIMAAIERIVHGRPTVLRCWRDAPLILLTERLIPVVVIRCYRRSL